MYEFLKALFNDESGNPTALLTGIAVYCGFRKHDKRMKK